MDVLYVQQRKSKKPRGGGTTEPYYDSCDDAGAGVEGGCWSVECRDVGGAGDDPLVVSSIVRFAGVVDGD